MRDGYTRTREIEQAMEHQFEEIQEEQGWTDETLLVLVLNYINAQALNDGLTNYLVAIAEEENGGSEQFARANGEVKQ